MEDDPRLMRIDLIDIELEDGTVAHEVHIVIGCHTPEAADEFARGFAKSMDPDFNPTGSIH